MQSDVELEILVTLQRVVAQLIEVAILRLPAVPPILLMMVCQPRHRCCPRFQHWRDHLPGFQLLDTLGRLVDFARDCPVDLKMIVGCPMDCRAFLRMDLGLAAAIR